MATVDPAPQPRLSDSGESAFGEDVEAVALLGSTFVGIALLPEHAPDFAKRASLGLAAHFSAKSPKRGRAQAVFRGIRGDAAAGPLWS